MPVAVHGVGGRVGDDVVSQRELVRALGRSQVCGGDGSLSGGGQAAVGPGGC